MEIFNDVDFLVKPENCTFSKPSCDDDSEGELKDSLPLLQPVWMQFLKHGDIVKSPLFPIALGIGTYFLCLIPYSVLDYWGRNWNWVQRCKIQPDSRVSWSMTREAIALTMWNQVLYVLPVTIAQCIWTPSTYLPCRAPGLWEFVWHHYAALVILDILFYTWHVLHHHNRFLYRHIHSIHHRFSTINCWASQYLHPWELISIGAFATVAPWIVGAHALTAWSFMVFVNFLSVDEHSGYMLPFAPHQWIPFYGTAAKHDMHHQRPMTNFQPYFVWFDWLADNHCLAQRKTKAD